MLLFLDGVDMPIFQLALAFLLLLAAPAWAGAESCTDGVDCFCDRIEDSEDPIYDANVVFCEDFENLAYYEDVPGAWYKASGGYRGHAAAWRIPYSSPFTECAGWAHGDPADPTLGITCNAPGSTCGTAEWHPTDLWQSNDRACIDVMRNGDFSIEVPSIDPPLRPNGASGVFDGQQSFAYRNAPGRTGGGLGEAQFGSTLTDIGITMAVGYSSNFEDLSANLFRDGAPWKHEQWRNTFGNIDSFFMINVGVGPTTVNPFRPVIIYAPGGTQSQCETSISQADIILGHLGCNSVSMQFGADESVYTQSTDWPWGTWGCVQLYVKGMDTSNMKYKTWFNERLITHIENLDPQMLGVKNGLTGMFWNHYANRNYPPNGFPLSTETAYRYSDNVVVTSAEPVSCTALGFEFGSLRGGTLVGGSLQ